jgi:hypothetical protein
MTEMLFNIVMSVAEMKSDPVRVYNHAVVDIVYPASDLQARCGHPVGQITSLMRL